MQKAVAERRSQDDAHGGTPIVSLPTARAGEAGKAKAEIEVIAEGLLEFPGLSGRDAALCRELLAFLREFKATSPPKLSLVRPLGHVARSRPAINRPLRYDEILIEFLREFEDAMPVLLARSGSARIAKPLQAAVKSAQAALQAATAELPDPAFRVPPYVSTLSKRAATKKAPVDAAAKSPVDAAAKRPHSRPAPVPVAQRVAPEPIAQRPAPEPIAEKANPVPTAQWPAPAAGTRWASAEPVGPPPAPAPAAKRQPRSAPVAVEKPVGLAAARAKALAKGLPD
jgi:hypothetical protein